MTSQDDANILRRKVMNIDQLRIWKISSEEDTNILKKFLNICSSKLTINEMNDLKQEEITNILVGIRDGKINWDQIIALDANELYDLIIGQARLF